MCTIFDFFLMIESLSYLSFCTIQNCCAGSYDTERNIEIDTQRATLYWKSIKERLFQAFPVVSFIFRRVPAVYNSISRSISFSHKNCNTNLSVQLERLTLEYEVSLIHQIYYWFWSVYIQIKFINTHLWKNCKDKICL